MCLDMNFFYFGLVPEEEHCRVESLEPFDEYEVSCEGLKMFYLGSLYKCSSGFFNLLAVHPTTAAFRHFSIACKTPSWYHTALSMESH